VTGQSATVYN